MYAKVQAKEKLKSSSKFCGKFLALLIILPAEVCIKTFTRHFDE